MSGNIRYSRNPVFKLPAGAQFILLARIWVVGINPIHRLLLAEGENREVIVYVGRLSTV